MIWFGIIGAFIVGGYCGYLLAAIFMISAQAEKYADNSEMDAVTADGITGSLGLRAKNSPDVHRDSVFSVTSVANPLPLVQIGQGDYTKKYYGDDLNDQATSLRRMVAEVKP